MIPKKIHYCWFGGNPLPELAVKCIESWKKHCPDYEIIEWNESNFDVDAALFTKIAYKEKKYAFVTDYARLFIILNSGGIYLDTDVELIKNLDDLLDQEAYVGTENFGALINPGSGFGAVKGSKIIAEFLNVYHNKSFENADGVLNMTPITCLLTPVLKEKGWKEDNSKQTIGGITVYPTEYFCPKDYDNILKVTDKTYSIHHFSGSWIDDDMKKNNEKQAKMSKRYGIKVGLIFSYVRKVYNRKGFFFLLKRLPFMIKRYFTEFF